MNDQTQQFEKKKEALEYAIETVSGYTREVLVSEILDFAYHYFDYFNEKLVHLDE
jgi:phosphoribosyl-ATP pyrophosphohydrolase